MRKILILSTCVAALAGILHAEVPQIIYSVSPSIGATLASLDGVQSEGDLSYQITGFLGLRNTVGRNAELSVSALLDIQTSDWLSYYDSEYLRAELRFDRVAIETTLLASLLGAGSLPRYVNPDWKIRLGTETELIYSGYLLLLPDVLGDLLFQGIRISHRYDPSIQFGLEFGAGAGWEYHYEHPVYSSGGDDTGEDRNDLILDASIAADGMIGFFSEWGISANGLLRLSNATFYSDSVYIDPSEDRIGLIAEASFFSSPHQSVTLEASVFADNSWYLARTARQADETYTTRPLYILDTGIDIRADWTPNQRIYFILEADGVYSYSNDPFVRSWSTGAKFGVEFTF